MTPQPGSFAVFAKVGLPERLLALGSLFYGALAFCLPVPPSEEIAALYPWWGHRIAIGNAQLYELIFLVWAVAFGWRFLVRALSTRGFPARQAALWLAMLALWCGLMSLLAPLPMLDMGRTLRLFLNVAMMLAFVRWTCQMHEAPLIALILGFLSGTAINLVLSFQYPLIVLETMRLSGQNTPGVAMGIAIHLAAWLFFWSTSVSWRLLAVVSTMVFSFGCAISYSRIGWFAGVMGLCAWIYILLLVRPEQARARKRLAITRLTLVPSLVIGLVFLLASPLGQEGLRWVATLAEQKFANQGESDTTRLAYAAGTAEIVARHPFGVGYSGFYDAMIRTDTYRSGTAAEEESVVDANPHAAFLWYTTAGGLPGGAMALLVFCLLLHSMRFGLVTSNGFAGAVLFVLVALPFLVIGLTVPYVFNSIILIAPTAVAAGWGWLQRSRQVDRTNAHELPGVALGN